MRGATSVLVTALALAGCGAQRAARTVARAGPPCSSGARAGDHSVAVLPGTPRVVVHVPPRLRAGAPAPLVVGLHGAGQDARGFREESAFDQVADERGFVTAYPQSWRPRGFWRYPEADNPRSGLRLLRATLPAVARVACVDLGRVLVTGISSGGRMTYAAGCELADVILAIAPVSGGVKRLPRCRPARRISVLDVHGTSDRIVSYRGVAPVVRGWARREGCRPEPQERPIDPYVTRFDWPRCRGGVKVAHLRVDGGGHAWPPLGGPPGIALDGAEAIWRFFAALPSR